MHMHVITCNSNLQPATNEH